MAALLAAAAGCSPTVRSGATAIPAAVPGARAALPLSARTLLVINDASPTSVSLGNDYARRRHVSNVVRVSCIDSAQSQTNESIDYRDFVARIERPIVAFLRSHPNVDYIVLTKGIPIRVLGARTGEAYGGQSRASLDSTLAAIGYDEIPGAVKVRFDDPHGYAVGYAWLNRYWNANGPFSHARYGGYLVTRLDAYTAAGAHALITRALLAESHLGNGPILFDIEPDFGLGDPKSEPAPIATPLITSESPYDTFNADMEHARAVLKARGIAVDADVSERFAGGKGLLGYYSWGSNDDHYSPAVYHSLRFAPGAIGDTAVSTSARSFFPQSYGQSMIADLIAQGITGVQGYTDEPLLQGVSSPTIVFDRFTLGYTLAESFYAGDHFVGWTTIVAGDAIARPYAFR